MTTAFAPRSAAQGQRVTYAHNGTLRRLEATEVDGRWVIQPETAADEAALKRHRMPVDEELAAKQEAEQAEAEKLTGDALDRRAAELNIEGRSAMNADQKRAAIAEAEEAAAADADSTPPAQPARAVNETNDQQGDGVPSSED